MRVENVYRRGGCGSDRGGCGGGGGGGGLLFEEVCLNSLLSPQEARSQGKERKENLIGLMATDRQTVQRSEFDRGCSCAVGWRW